MDNIDPPGFVNYNSSGTMTSNYNSSGTLTNPYNSNVTGVYPNDIINSLDINNRYLQSQLSYMYERNANLEFDNYTLKNKLTSAYSSLDKLEDELQAILITKLKGISKKPNENKRKRKSEEDENSYINELNRTYKKNKNSLSDQRISEIIENLKNIEDIVNLPDDNLIRHNKDMKKLLNIRKPLKKLNDMVGLENIKDELFKHIIYFIINKENIYENNRLHTVIQGPPGVGKTEFGKILGEIYLGMGFLKNNKFKMVKRSDLIGQYLGQTAVQTQNIIDDILGGVLFIDEAYSLGNSEKRDSYSKECLDTINRNLTENGNKFICIIAGYEKDLQECFFKSNSGLERRFTFKYNIDGYSSDELMQIFLDKCKFTKWKCNINKDKLSEFFKNYELPYFAGDIDRLLFQSQLVASLRLFKEHNENDIKNIILDDLEEAISFIIKKQQKEDDYWKTLYM